MNKAQLWGHAGAHLHCYLLSTFIFFSKLKSNQKLLTTRFASSTLKHFPFYSPRASCKHWRLNNEPIVWEGLKSYLLGLCGMYLSMTSQLRGECSAARHSPAADFNLNIFLPRVSHHGINISSRHKRKSPAVVWLEQRTKSLIRESWLPGGQILANRVMLRLCRRPGL